MSDGWVNGLREACLVVVLQCFQTTRDRLTLHLSHARIVTRSVRVAEKTSGPSVNADLASCNSHRMDVQLLGPVD